MRKRDLKRLFDVQNRRSLYRLVQRRPGIHLRQLQRESGIPMSTLVYHLRRLRKAGLVVTRRKDRYKAYFTVGELDRRDKDYLYYLRQPTPRRIALEVARRPFVQLSELVRIIGMARSTVTFHLKKLVGEGMVREEVSGRRKYYIVRNPIRLRRLVAFHGHSFESKAPIAPATPPYAVAPQP